MSQRLPSHRTPLIRQTARMAGSLPDQDRLIASLAFTRVNGQQASMATLALGNAFSLAAWVKYSDRSANVRVIMSEWQNTLGTGFLWVAVNGAIQFHPNAGQTLSVNETVVSDNNWHLLVAVADAAGLVQSIYSDGAVLGSAAYNGTGTPTTQPLLIGENGNANTQPWNGLIAAPRLWSRALTATEIAALYQNNAVPRTNLLGEWLLSEGGGLTVADTSGRGNTGTLTNLPFSADVPF